MAETSPPPTAGAESCSEEPARGGEQLPEEPRRTPAGGADREGEAGPPLASPAGQSEPGSPVAAPFFLLYPGDGGAGFAACPPPQQQRSWRTPPSPGSPLPFLLLSYPSGGGGGGKHREWRREEGTRPRRVRGGEGELPRSGRRTVYLRVSPGRGLPPGLPSRAGRSSSPASHVLAGSQPPVPGWEPSPEEPRRGRRPETRQPGWPAFCGLPAPRPRSRCGCCVAAARAASVVPLKFLRAFTPHP